MRKMALEIEHANGKIEKLRVSRPIALMIAQRLVESGWPYCGIKVNGNQLISRDPCMSNVFRDTQGHVVIV